MRRKKLAGRAVDILLMCLITGCSMFKSGPEKFFEDQQLYAARAIADGDMKRLRAVARPSEIDRPGKKGMTLLWFAIQEKRFDAIEVLVSLGSNPDQQVVQGLGTPFLHALEVEDLRFLTAMLDGGLPVNQVRDGGESLLYRAAGPHGRTFGHVELLVQRGADVNLPRDNGETPIFSAILTMEPERARYLAEHGADVNVSTSGGVTPGWAIHSIIQRQQPDSALRRRFEDLRDLMISKGAKWPPDPPDKVRAWRKAQGLRVAE
jgi:ankyrin repeat protein